MSTVYIRDQQAQLRRNGSRIVVESDGRVVRSLPLSQIDQIILMSNVEVSTPLMKTLLHHAIDLVFMSSRGHYRGRLRGEKSKHARLRHKQVLYFYAG